MAFARPLCFAPVTLAALCAAPAHADPLQDFLSAADLGQCIEHVSYRMIRLQGADRARPIVQDALAALSQREHQQRALGCEGDIAA